MSSLAKPVRASESDQGPLPPPIALSELQMMALLAASTHWPPDARGPFMEACARELAALPELGDGVLHRTIRTRAEALFRPARPRWPDAPREQVGAVIGPRPIRARP